MHLSKLYLPDNIKYISESFVNVKRKIRLGNQTETGLRLFIC